MDGSVARVGAVVGAIAWFIGVPLIGLAGVVPSDAEYLFSGAVGIVLGIAVVSVAYSPVFRTRTRISLLVRVSGAGIGLLLAAASALLALAAEGVLGERAPEWIPTAAAVPLFALFLWIPAASFLFRRSLGRALSLLAAVSALGFLSSVPLSLANFVATNATIPLILVLGVVSWLGPSAWLIGLVARMDGSIEPAGTRRDAAIP